MIAREVEAALLKRCAAVAREANLVATDQREANVFRLAAMVIQSRFPHEATRLMAASERYFAGYPSEQLPSVDVIRRGWVVNLPRLRDRLSRELQLR
jgi:hypothetical protein